MNGSTAIFDFENILENEKANYNCIKEKEVMESLNFYEKNKVEQSLYSFLNHRFFGIPFFLSAMFISFSLGFILFFLTILLFHSVGVTLVSWMFGTFLGIPLSFSLFEKVKVKAKNKYEVKWFKQMSQNIDGKHNFFDESFLSSTASPELIVAFEKEMGRQYLIDMYVANNGDELTNEMLVDHFNKRDNIAQEENNLRILYEDCIKKVEDKHLLCAK